MTKTRKHKNRQSVKTILVKDTLVVHKKALTAYKIFCESENGELIKGSMIIEDKIQLIEIVEYKNTYLFYEDFKTISSLNYLEKVSIRRKYIDGDEIEKRAWKYLTKILLSKQTLDLYLLDSLKINMPEHIQKKLFNGQLTSQWVLDKMNIKRYQYDYLQKKNVGNKPSYRPSFLELIQEARNENK